VKNIKNTPLKMAKGIVDEDGSGFQKKCLNNFFPFIFAFKLKDLLLRGSINQLISQNTTSVTVNIFHTFFSS